MATGQARSGGRTAKGRERGATLVMSLFLLIAVLLLAASAAGLALMGEKAARAERDRHVALQSAEDALMDAEHDIDTAPAERAELLAAADGFAPGCGSGAALGLCAPMAAGDPPPWQAVDLEAEGASVPFGHFTGAAMETGEGFLPLKRPRYVIERIPYQPAGAEAGATPGFHYRVTAIGFGSRDGTRVVLQSSYRRPED